VRRLGVLRCVEIGRLTSYVSLPNRHRNGKLVSGLRSLVTGKLPETGDLRPVTCDQFYLFSSTPSRILPSADGRAKKFA
jgi:hypothetical protein